MQFNLGSMLTNTRRLTPDAVLMRTDRSVHSYAEIDDRSGRFAAGLLGSGVAPGDRGALLLPNSVEFLVAYFGMLKAGMVVVPLNPMLTPVELGRLLGDARITVVVTAVDSVVSVVHEQADPGQVQLVGAHALATDSRVRPFGELEAPALPVMAAVGRDADDTAVVIYTSGTTGRPKGAELGHLQMMLVTTIESDMLAITGDDLTLAVLPFFHIYGLSGLVHSAVRRGEALYVMDDFDADELVRAITRHGITVLAGVPTMFGALLQSDWSGADLSSVRLAISGGAPMPAALLAELQARLPGMEYVEGYGMSESTGAGTINGGAFPRRPGSIGRALWGMQLQVTAPDGTPLPPGPEHTGELLMRGPHVMKGYLSRPEATREVLRDGWLHTGDLAYLDQDGYAYLVGRIKDVIIRGGYNVYARDVEEVLHTHPAVAEAVVFGRPDAHLGEEVVAAVALRDGHAATPEELIAFTREQVAAYKYPREVLVLPALPKGPTGKIRKDQILTGLVGRPSGR